ncbi:serine hydrolase, partial [Photobacterium sp. OFAV2-7]|uniref:serine hydrolase domain-containing protein n=1 Tax=Photobacterium sp. OFAV2-7 TaxID=2917748 RepID=UPI001EF74710
MCRLWSVFLLLLPLGAALPAPKDEIVFALDSYVKKSVKKGIPGASLAVIINGNIRLLRGYGVTKAGGNKRINSATVFPLASISKTFASAATSILVSKGLIEWDTHVIPYLDNIEFSDPDLGKSVTLRHLLSHTTGLVPQAYSDML